MDVTRPRFGGLDGVRGLAALAIVIHHASLYTGSQGAMAGGDILRRLDIGVPVFFVLSGFLIHRPFAAARAAGERVDLPDYLRARALRLLPAYWVALAIVALVPWLVDVYPSIEAVRTGDWWRYAGLLQIYDADTAGQGFAHAWTLCTELSFYLVVPLWAWLLRRASPRAEIAALLALGLLSFALREVTYARPEAIGGWYPFGLTIGGTFLWFSVGMSAAVWSVQRGERTRPPLPPGPAWALGVGVFLLLSLAAGLPHSTAAPSAVGELLIHGGYAVIAALLVVPLTGAGGADDGRVGRALRTRPMRRLGEVSYGVYLWHPIVIVALLDVGIGRDAFLVLAPATAAVSILLGTLSYEVVERPARRLRGRRSVRDVTHA